MNYNYSKMSKPGQSGVKLTLLITGVLLLFGLAAWIGLYGWYKANLKPVNPDDSSLVSFVVEPGTSARTIASNLEEAELVRNANVFSWYVDREGYRNQLQAGTYRLSKSMDVPQIAQDMADGNVATDFVTILPEKRLDEIKAALVEFGFEETEVNLALSRNYDHPLLRYKPKNASLEGYIFPETYNTTAQNSVEELILRSFDEFYSRIKPEHLDKLKKRGISLHEAVILSSIVARESGSDRPEIASVFYNRLDAGMPLGSDATFYYAADVNNVERDASLDHPYNTRIYKGLPPGPISNFTFDAFEAVVNPADTDYLYFVSGDPEEGKESVNHFSETFEEHKRNVELYCKQNCEIQDRTE